MSGLKQDEFAALCGIPKETYRAIERKMNSENPWISEYHAEQIALVAGVDVKALMRNELFCLDGKIPYTTADWDNYRKTLSKVHARIDEQIFEKIKSRIVHACAMADAGPLLWYASLAIEIDHFYKGREALLKVDASTPTLVSIMRTIVHDEVALNSVDGTVEAEKLRRPARRDNT